jgi:hypothetical protein
MPQAENSVFQIKLEMVLVLFTMCDPPYPRRQEHALAPVHRSLAVPAQSSSAECKRC